MKHKRGVINMAGIKYEMDDCPCLKCMYLIQAIRLNEEPDGKCDLRIHCGISGCPNGFMQNAKNLSNEECIKARNKIFNCIEMLKRCIEQKSNGSDVFE